MSFRDAAWRRAGSAALATSLIISEGGLIAIASLSFLAFASFYIG